MASPTAVQHFLRYQVAGLKQYGPFLCAQHLYDNVACDQHCIHMAIGARPALIECCQITIRCAHCTSKASMQQPGSVVRVAAKRLQAQQASYWCWLSWQRAFTAHVWHSMYGTGVTARPLSSLAMHLLHRPYLRKHMAQHAPGAEQRQCMHCHSHTIPASQD
jgi:hypothetical protein